MDEVSKLDHVGCLVYAYVCEYKQKYARIFLPLEFLSGIPLQTVTLQNLYGEPVKINPWDSKLEAIVCLYKGP